MVYMSEKILTAERTASGLTNLYVRDHGQEARIVLTDKEASDLAALLTGPNGAGQKTITRY